MHERWQRTSPKAGTGWRTDPAVSAKLPPRVGVVAQASSSSGGRPGPEPGTETESGTEVETKLHRERMWRVIVWDDPINLMSYVTYVLQRLFGFDLEKATQLMLKVHHEGRCIVAIVARERGEVMVGKLHAFGLQATLSRFGE